MKEENANGELMAKNGKSERGVMVMMAMLQFPLLLIYLSFISFQRFQNNRQMIIITASIIIIDSVLQTPEITA